METEKLNTVKSLFDVLSQLFTMLEIKVDVRVNSDDAVEIDGWLWAYVDKMTERTNVIGGVRTNLLFDCFVIGVTKYSSATRWCPEELDRAELDRVHGSYNAAKRMASLYFESRVDGALEQVEFGQSEMDKIEIKKALDELL